MSAPHRIDVHHHRHLTVEELAGYDGFDAAARAAIERDNALALLPRLRDRAGGARHA
jgi:hypothetical protein